MYKLVSSCLLFIGFLNPLLSLPVTDSREVSPGHSAADEDASFSLDALERASPLQMSPETLSAENTHDLQKAGPTTSTSTINSRGSVRKFQAFSGRDPQVLLSHLLARTRKQYNKQGTPSECFWKYCV
ncbi:urotensin-2 [Orycteropus afer afer]|uniref:Urotensin-2 n=1 Tax=Orycteropus afer afer TaxID=1230840 RepID=A0A8B6ZYS0_ORYAF|nr:urotensin-2 [Orycteropus afer afer]